MSAETPVRPVGPAPVAPGRTWVKVMLGIAIALIALMWVYAFAFAKRDGINRIDDREWATRGEAVCAGARADLIKLRDPRTIEESGAQALTEKAAIVERANAVLTAMVDALEADVPTDEKGQSVVPRWIADYRVYLDDRYAVVDALRRGENVLLNETEIKGTPISYFINDFARQNDMDSCSTPIDLAV